MMQFSSLTLELRCLLSRNGHCCIGGSGQHVTCVHRTPYRSAGLPVHSLQPPIGQLGVEYHTPTTPSHPRASTCMTLLAEWPAPCHSFLPSCYGNRTFQAGRDSRVGGAPGVLAPPKLYNEAQGKEAVAAAKVRVEAGP